jgi:UDP-N-acetylglucosamine 2-epimerase (non-hydrolysing)
LKKLKIVTIVGTRPEIIRLSVLIPKLDTFTDHTLVHTGQNFDPQLNEVFFEDLGIRNPDLYLNVDTSSLGAVMADTIRHSERVFKELKPDAVVILGDTNSAMAAIVAERMHIPVYHLEAGNRSFDWNVPEELNRKLVDHISTFNLPYNDHSYRNLVTEGIHPRFLNKTGSPIREIVEKYKERILGSEVIERLGLETNQYFLVSLHRQETVDFPARLKLALDSISNLHSHYGLPVVVSTHPRTKKRLPVNFETENPNIRFLEPFGYFDYNKLQMDARCVISDSGTVTEEAAILGFKAVILRDATERPEGLEAGSIALSSLNSNLASTVDFVCRSGPLVSVPQGYEHGDFSQNVLNFIISSAPLAKKWKNQY